MIAYVDTSVVLQFVLEGAVELNHAFEFPVTVSSELVEVEAIRVLERLRMQRRLDDESRAEAMRRLLSVLESIDLWEITNEVKARARGAFPTILGTLDAFHLATALCHPEVQNAKDVVVFSYDRQMNLCGAALGMVTPLFER